MLEKIAEVIATIIKYLLKLFRFKVKKETLERITHFTVTVVTAFISTFFMQSCYYA